jgi:hypothetical protein
MKCSPAAPATEVLIWDYTCLSLSRSQDPDLKRKRMSYETALSGAQTIFVWRWVVFCAILWPRCGVCIGGALEAYLLCFFCQASISLISFFWLEMMFFAMRVSVGSLPYFK